jgi:hypothetical protein
MTDINFQTPAWWQWRIRRKMRAFVYRNLHVLDLDLKQGTLTVWRDLWPHFDRRLSRVAEVLAYWSSTGDWCEDA